MFGSLVDGLLSFGHCQHIRQACVWESRFEPLPQPRFRFGQAALQLSVVFDRTHIPYCYWFPFSFEDYLSSWVGESHFGWSLSPVGAANRYLLARLQDGALRHLNGLRLGFHSSGATDLHAWMLLGKQLFGVAAILCLDMNRLRVRVASILRDFRLISVERGLLRLDYFRRLRRWLFHFGRDRLLLHRRTLDYFRLLSVALCQYPLLFFCNGCSPLLGSGWVDATS